VRHLLALAACASLAACAAPPPPPLPPPPPPVVSLTPPPPTVIEDRPIPNPPALHRHYHKGRYHYYAHRYRGQPVRHTSTATYRRHVAPHHSGAPEPPGSVPASSPPNSPLPR